MLRAPMDKIYEAVEMHLEVEINRIGRSGFVLVPSNSGNEMKELKRLGFCLNHMIIKI